MHAIKYGNSCYMKQIPVGVSKKGVKLFKPVWLIQQGSLKKWITTINVRKGERIKVTGDDGESDDELAAVDDEDIRDGEEASRELFSWADEV